MNRIPKDKSQKREITVKIREQNYQVNQWDGEDSTVRYKKMKDSQDDKDSEDNAIPKKLTFFHPSPLKTK